MLLTTKIKLNATQKDKAFLSRTIVKFNECCDWLSEQVWNSKIFRKYDIHHEFYYCAREKFPELASNIVIRCIAKVAAAYKLGKKEIVRFQQFGAISYDRCLLSWKRKADVVSIWTTNGRRKVNFVCNAAQHGFLKKKKDSALLVLRNNQFYLYVPYIVQEQDVSYGFYKNPLGIDFGIVNIATDSDGNTYSGAKLKNTRCKQRILRKNLQKVGSRSSKRHLKKISGKEARFARDVNHCISKRIVSCAKGTNRGIALEDLSGIRDRITVRRAQRAILHSWSFNQLRTFIEYKSRLAGITVIAVNPSYTSQECSQCHYIDKRNRKTQDKFL